MSLDPRYLDLMFDMSPVAVAVADEGGRYVEVNPAYCRTFGYTREELLGNSFRLILRPEDEYLEPAILRMALANDPTAPEVWRARDKAGRGLTVRSSFRCLNEPGRPIRIVTMLADITELTASIARLEQHEARLQRANADLEVEVAARTRELRAANAVLQRLALEDPLTGAANRRRFSDYAVEVLGRHGGGRPSALILLDLDHFKEINDTHGHLVGDQVLVEVARRVLALLRAEDLLGRWGGEEFTLLLPGVDLEGAGALGARILAGLGGTPISTAAGALAVGCSGGVVQARPGESLDGLLARADVAMYAAKRAGRNRMVRG